LAAGQDLPNGFSLPLQNRIAPRGFTSLNGDTPFQLCFLRHGQSTWNRDNRFIGWTDTPLTDDGVLEARIAGQMLAKSGILFDEVHTSLLRRSIRTTNLVLMEMGQEYIPVHKHWRLNERNYGALVGHNKKQIVKMHGKEQVLRWRRSYDEPPPPMEDNHKYHPARDPRYRHMLDEIPKSESLKCTLERSRVYWDEAIAPSLKEGKTVLIVGHENNLRSLIMRLEDIPEDDIINLNLPRAVPLAYRLDENLKPLDRLDGKLDEATGFLRGEWLGGDDAVAEILTRDHKQVYDTTIEENLEQGKDRQKWKKWMEFAAGKPTLCQTVNRCDPPVEFDNDDDHSRQVASSA
jgi:2,3-bisphosphoglycerate-dependent phosphoglycerate mutase